MKIITVPIEQDPSLTIAFTVALPNATYYCTVESSNCFMTAVFILFLCHARNGRPNSLYSSMNSDESNDGEYGLVMGRCALPSSFIRLA